MWTTKENSRLQILEVGQVARLESVPATSVRVVLPPKSELASSGNWSTPIQGRRVIFDHPTETDRYCVYSGGGRDFLSR